MKNFVARAIQVSCLMRNQLEQIQVTERRLGHLIANWNIQELFNLLSTREIYRIPDNPEAQANHSIRIEKHLKEKGLCKTEEENGLEWYHSFDWNVFNNIDQINWEYFSTGNKSSVLS